MSRIFVPCLFLLVPVSIYIFFFKSLILTFITPGPVPVYLPFWLSCFLESVPNCSFCLSLIALLTLVDRSLCTYPACPAYLYCLIISSSILVLELIFTG